MSVTFRCPDCGKSHAADESLAGRKVACRGCGKGIRVPGGVSSGETVQFDCVGCGKEFSVPAKLAGKKITCKACNCAMLIPEPIAAPPPAPTTSAASRPSKPSTAKVAAPAAPLADIFELDEPAPPPPPRRGGDDLFADAPRDARPTSSGDDAPLPPRAGAFEPMTEAKKKAINKRADKINRMKPSFAGAGMGVSFGTIIAITLFGLRLYRIGTRFHRAAQDPPAVIEPAAVSIDPKEMAAGQDREVKAMIASPDAAEAREWLDPAKHPDHGVMEMQADAARKMVDGFYERGAKRVSVLDTTKLGNAVITAMIAVELPDEPEKRSQCLAWEVPYLQGEEPSKDVGQKYLLITTD